MPAPTANTPAAAPSGGEEPSATAPTTSTISGAAPRATG
jgi:hypothetical protein